VLLVLLVGLAAPHEPVVRGWSCYNAQGSSLKMEQRRWRSRRNKLPVARTSPWMPP